MPSVRACLQCGAELPADAPKGLCPKCLFAAAMIAAESDREHESVASAAESDKPQNPRGIPESPAGPDLTTPLRTAELPTVPVSESDPHELIGRYKILQKLGEGGCGMVYMAEQQEPVKRRVALKVIKLGMDTKQVIARFEAERQALALMDHPNIAKVLDGGATERGRPYFVMELVKGVPVTRYCDENKLDTRQRLDLFIQVCQAVQHAHQKGIIHRDIKPSNILVADHDGVPVPKVIDFGIAKATTGQMLTDKTLFTAFEQFIGTPAYMSPEQAKLSGLDIDTRSDIYSLGILLYELLTSKTPFDTKHLVQAGFAEICRIIREEEPPRPSTRLSALETAEQTTVAKQRQSDPPKLASLLRGDLDWIVMKTLEKDRNRRYETANGLAMDIRRYLKGDPVVARHPSPIYLLQKSISRHKVALAVACGFTLILTTGLALSTFEALRAARAERIQGKLLEQARSAQAQETVQRQKATASAEEGLARLVRLDVANGIRLVDDGDLAASLPWFTEALRLEESKSEKEELHRIRIRAVLKECPMLLQIWFHKAPLTSIHFNSDGQRVVTASRDHTAQVWDTKSGEPVGLPLQHSGIVWLATFSSDGLRVITASEDGTARIWNARTGEASSKALQHQGQVLDAAFSPDGKVVATASDDGTASLWDANSGAPLGPSLRHAAAVRHVAFSPDGKLVATGCDDAIVRVWELGTQDKGPPATFTHSGPLTSISFNTEGDELLACSRDGSARVWSLNDYQKYICPPINHFGPVLHGAFSPNSRSIVTACANGAAQIYDLASGQRNGEEFTHRGAVQWVTFDSEGRRVVTAGADRTAAVWDVNTSKLCGSRLLHGAGVGMAEFSQDGRYVVTASDDGIARLWDLADFPTAYRRMRDEAPAWQSSSSPDGNAHAVRDFDRVELIQVKGAVPDASANSHIAHAAPIRYATFNSNGKWVATASDDQTARVWEAATGRPNGPPLEHAAPVHLLAFSSDSRLLATATADRIVRVWSAVSGEALTPNLQCDAHITNLWFSSAGDLLLANREDGSRQSWSLSATSQPLETLKQIAELLSSRHLDSTRTSLEALSPSNLANLWQQVRETYRAEFTSIRQVPAQSVATGPMPKSSARRQSDSGAPKLDPAGLAVDGGAGGSQTNNRISSRASDAGRWQIDLTAFYNVDFSQPDWPTPGENSHLLLDVLPRGIADLAGVEFDIRGIIQLTGVCLAARVDRHYPEQIKDIPVRAKCLRLHFLQATGWNVAEGMEIGSFVIHYADHERRTVPIVYGEDVRDWWSVFGNPNERTARARVAWTAPNPLRTDAGARGLRLYLRTWENPMPQHEIRSLDFVSAQTCCAPFLLGITADRPPENP